MRFISVILLLLTLPVVTAQRIDAAQNSAPETAPKTSARNGSMTNEDVQAMRQDVARMKALVQQMQTNLAFVDTSQSPLKHQFQLEIDMWQTVIIEMDRRLDQASREPGNRK